MYQQQNQLFSSALDEFYTVEGFSSFSDWLSDIAKGIKEYFAKVGGTVYFTIPTEPAIDKAAVSLVESLSASGLNSVMVNKPSRLGTNMVAYIGHLDLCIESLKDVESRLYDPVIKYLAEIITTEGEVASKVWNPRDLKLADLNKLQSEMGRHLSDKNDYQDNVPFTKVYGRGVNLKASYDSLVRVAKTTSGISIDSLLTKEKRLMGLVDDLLATPESLLALDKSAMKETRKRLGESLKAVAAEVEFLAVVIYEINKAIAANNDNMRLIAKS